MSFESSVDGKSVVPSTLKPNSRPIENFSLTSDSKVVFISGGYGLPGLLTLSYEALKLVLAYYIASQTAETLPELKEKR